MKATTILILLAFSGWSSAQTPEFTTRDALRAHQDYQKRIKDADIQYYKDLDAAQKVAMKDGKLEEANTIQKEIEKLKGRFVTLEHGNNREVTVSADRPEATGITLKKGQKFSLDPNREDKWGGGGSKKGVLCDFLGYDSRGNKWMHMMYRIGEGKGTPVEEGKLETAQQDGELFLYAFDDKPAGNTGKIRVSVVVSPE
jgi:hypothetical protein